MIACSLAAIHRLTSAAFVVAVALGLVACKQETNRSENPPTVVQVETVTLTEYAPTVRLTGDIRAEVESDLSFRVSGRIIERTVDVGDHVTADQVLARLDPQQQQATVTAAEAAVQAAEAVLRQATSTYERQKALLAQGFTTKREHDQAEEAYRTAQASLDAAQAQLGTARDQLSYTVLRAGVPGVITARNAETGQVVQVAQSVFSIAQDGPRDAVFHVHESIFTNEPGDPAIELTLVSDPAVKAKGTRSRGLSDRGRVERNRQGQGRYRKSAGSDDSRRRRHRRGSFPALQARDHPVERRFQRRRPTCSVDRRSPDQDSVAEADHHRSL